MFGVILTSRLTTTTGQGLTTVDLPDCVDIAALTQNPTTHTLDEPLRTINVNGLVDVITTVLIVAPTVMTTGCVAAATLREPALLDSPTRTTPVVPSEPA